MSLGVQSFGGGLRLVGVTQPDEGTLRLLFSNGTHVDFAITAGLPGADGKTIRNGAGAPNNAVGNDGDFYIDPGAQKIYGPKAGGVWPAGVVLKGTDGNAILSGAGAPANGTGVDGNFYIDTTAKKLHGPKAGGVWPAGTSLIGPQGPAGATGPQGRWAGEKYYWADGPSPPSGNPHNLGIGPPGATDNSIGFDQPIWSGFGNFANVRKMWATVKNADNANISGILARVAASTSAVKAIVKVRRLDTPNFLMLLRVDSLDGTFTQGGITWYRWNVMPIGTVQNPPAGLAMQDSQVMFEFLPTGDKGDTGSSSDDLAALEDRVLSAEGDIATLQASTSDLDVLRTVQQKNTLPTAVARVTGSVDLGDWSQTLASLNVAVGKKLTVTRIYDLPAGNIVTETFTAAAGNTVQTLVDYFVDLFTPGGGLLSIVGTGPYEVRISGDAEMLAALGLEAAVADRTNDAGTSIDASRVGFNADYMGGSTNVQETIAAIEEITGDVVNRPWRRQLQQGMTTNITKPYAHSNTLFVFGPETVAQLMDDVPSGNMEFDVLLEWYPEAFPDLTMIANLGDFIEVIEKDGTVTTFGDGTDVPQVVCSDRGARARVWARQWPFNANHAIMWSIEVVKGTWTGSAVEP